MGVADARIIELEEDKSELEEAKAAAEAASKEAFALREKQTERIKKAKAGGNSGETHHWQYFSPSEYDFRVRVPTVGHPGLLGLLLGYTGRYADLLVCLRPSPMSLDACSLQHSNVGMCCFIHYVVPLSPTEYSGVQTCTF